MAQVHVKVMHIFAQTISIHWHRYQIVHPGLVVKISQLLQGEAISRYDFNRHVVFGPKTESIMLTKSASENGLHKYPFKWYASTVWRTTSSGQAVKTIMGIALNAGSAFSQTDSV